MSDKYLKEEEFNKENAKENMHKPNSPNQNNPNIHNLKDKKNPIKNKDQINNNNNDSDNYENNDDQNTQKISIEDLKKHKNNQNLSNDSNNISNNTSILEEKIKSLTKQLEESQEQLKKSKENTLYLRAEFENYKKNIQKEKVDLIKYGCQEFALSLLDILDNFERALSIKISPETIDSFHEGIKITAKELSNILKKHGIYGIDSLGKPFDPMVHEALSSEETDNVPPGHISQVYKKPYKFHDKIIRIGQVVVAKDK